MRGTIFRHCRIDPIDQGNSLGSTIALETAPFHVPTAVAVDTVRVPTS
jgi:hypothetical protein